MAPAKACQVVRTPHAYPHLGVAHVSHGKRATALRIHLKPLWYWRLELELGRRSAFTAQTGRLQYKLVLDLDHYVTYTPSGW